MGNQCRATAKRTGQRCLQIVGPGAVVCRMHGGRARQVELKALERRLIADALAGRKAIDPRDALSDALSSMYALKEMIAEQLAAGNPSPAFDGGQLVDALDRLVKYSQVAINAGVEERRVRIAEQMGGQIVAVIRSLLDGIGATPAQRALAPTIIADFVRGQSSDRRVIEA